MNEGPHHAALRFTRQSSKQNTQILWVSFIFCLLYFFVSSGRNLEFLTTLLGNKD